MGIVRETYAKCANVKQILRTLLIKFEERDVFMSNEYQKEIKDRMQSIEIQVPQLFVDGQYIGVSTQFIPILSFAVKHEIFSFRFDELVGNFAHFLFRHYDVRAIEVGHRTQIIMI